MNRWPIFALLFVVLIATGCAFALTRAPQARQITADEAREIAILSFTSSEPVTVLSVDLSTVGAAMKGTGANPRTPAWTVRLSGSYYDANFCPADKISEPDCPAHTTTALAVIAVNGGEFWGERPAPNAPE